MVRSSSFPSRLLPRSDRAARAGRGGPTGSTGGFSSAPKRSYPRDSGTFRHKWIVLNLGTLFAYAMNQAEKAYQDMKRSSNRITDAKTVKAHENVSNPFSLIDLIGVFAAPDGSDSCHWGETNVRTVARTAVANAMRLRCALSAVSFSPGLCIGCRKTGTIPRSAVARRASAKNCLRQCPPHGALLS